MNHECDHEDCTRPARMAVRAVRKPDHQIHVQAQTEVAKGRGWLPYCKEHGIATTSDLLYMVVGSDSVPDVPR